MEKLYIGLAEILEIENNIINPDFTLTNTNVCWDSLAVISTIALIDELFNCTVNGEMLSNCKKISDIEKLITEAIR
jgi:acyl carrier protein